VTSLLADTARRLAEGHGWLRVDQQSSSLPVGLTEATLGDLFTIYRAFAENAQ
jgi:hypothetical protein